MAERRSVRSSSRRITPTPQPQPIELPQPSRPTRKRATRSASRDVESMPPATKKTTRRNARQTSVASDGADYRSTRPSGRKALKEPVLELATVEEVDTQIALESGLQTPPRPQRDLDVLHRSPGTASQMSGTTAISSFSMLEAESLDSRSIIRHLPKLYSTATEFLQHLAPGDGRIEDDERNIQEMQKPDSDFTQDYRDYDLELSLRLSKYRDEHQQYIRLRTVRRALLGPDRDPSTMRSGIDAVLYLANLAIFAKHMIGTDREEKEIWNALRELDRDQFPHLFLPALVAASTVQTSPAGESILVKETFNLALELRTQLCILVLDRGVRQDNPNLDELLEEVFAQAEEEEGPSVRGWDIPGLGYDDEELPPDFQAKIRDQMDRVRSKFLTDGQSQERGEFVDFEDLSAEFPWRSVILQLLHWVRLRHRELQEIIKALGGIQAITNNVKLEVENPDDTADPPVEKPRRSRTSFGRIRRRSSRKFHADDPENDAGVDALLEREQRVHLPEVVDPQPQQAEEEPMDLDGVRETIRHKTPQDVNEEEDWQQDLPEEHEPREASVTANAIIPGPPQSSAAWASEFQKGKGINKENQRRFIDRQANARQVEFGTGFEDSQPTPGPSTQSKGKQREDRIPQKRARIPFVDSDDEEDAFEREDRNARAQERRRNAPVAKKVRIDPSSSAPTSHQPPAQNRNRDIVPIAQEDNVSETEEAEITEQAPPSSKYDETRELSRRNSKANAVRKRHKQVQTRAPWTAEAEGAFLQYMAKYPRQYAGILEEDKRRDRLLQDRTQVNLKDKARNMAANMIKAGTGLHEGFEDLISHTSKFGKQLLEEGYEW